MSMVYRRNNSTCNSPYRASQGSSGKECDFNAGDARDAGSVPGWGRLPGGGNGTPLQYSCLENSIDKGAWWAIVHGVAKSNTRLSDWTLIVLKPGRAVSLELVNLQFVPILPQVLRTGAHNCAVTVIEKLTFYCNTKWMYNVLMCFWHKTYYNVIHPFLLRNFKWQMQFWSKHFKHMLNWKSTKMLKLEKTIYVNEKGR